MPNEPQLGQVWAAFEGPLDKPNGKLRVMVVRPDTMGPEEVARFYICTVMDSVKMNGSTSQPGNSVRIPAANFISKLS